MSYALLTVTALLIQAIVLMTPGSTFPDHQIAKSALALNYSIDRWTTEEGLPQNTISSIAQTSDGYLWVGTFAGLARFDGIRFTVFDGVNTPALRSGRVRYLHVSTSGALWITTEFGELTRLEKGVFTPLQQGLPRAGVCGVAEDNQGHLYVGSRGLGAMYQLVNDRFAEVARSEDPPLHSLFGLINDSDGTIWAGQATNLIKAWPGTAKLIPILDRGEVVKVLALGSARDGGIWLGTSGGVQKLRHGQTAENRRSPRPINTVASVCEDARGTVWMGTWDQGLLLFGPDQSFQHFTSTFDPGRHTVNATLSEVRVVFEDRESNIWLGTHSGLLRCRKRIFHTYTTHDGLPSQSIRAVSEDNQGNIWAAADKAAYLPKGKPEEIKVFNIPSQGARTLWPDRHGGMWIGTHGNNLYHWSNERMTPDHDSSSTIFHSLFQDREGHLWAGTPSRLQRMVGTNEFEHPMGVIDVRVITEDSAGNLLLGSNGAGIRSWNGDHWKQYKTSSGHLSEKIWSLYPDSSGILWIGTYGAGLQRLKGDRVFDYSITPLPLPRFIHAILEDDLGYFWFASNKGIYRVARQTLEDFAQGRPALAHISHYGPADGLATSDCTGGGTPVAVKARDGRLWFSSNMGLSVVDPSAIQHNSEAPPVMIELLQADSTPIRPRFDEVGADLHWPPAAPLSITAPQWVPRVPAGTSRLELIFSGISLASPQRVRFRFRLEGVDKNWIETSERSAAYSRLSPGNYQFQVTAANRDGVWNDTPAQLAFVVLPFYWQTNWFRASLIAALFLFAWLFYRWRVIQLEAVNRVRLRIAHDLHDEIGANLGSIGLNTELLQTDAVLTDRQRNDLLEISKLTKKTASTVRDIVWFTNPDFDNLAEMTEKMRQTANLILAGREHEFITPEKIQPLPLLLEVRQNLFFMFKEALHNIVKHSLATKVRIELKLSAGSIWLSISDNGKGFDFQIVAPGTGLKSLRKRSAELSGETSIFSNDQGGTTVTIRVPLHQPRLFRHFASPPGRVAT